MTRRSLIASFGGFHLPGASPASPRAVAAGRQAQAAGETSEAFWASQHLAARTLLLARVRHISPRVRWVGRGKQAVARVVGEAGADYMGCVVGGMSLVAESKSSAGPRLARSELKACQVEDLDGCVALGGVALLLVELHIDGRPRRFAVPWSEVRWREVGRGASVGIEEIGEWEVKSGECYLSRFVRREGR